MSDAKVWAITITSTEWRHLLGYSEIRVSRRRAQEVDVPPTSKERDRLFGWAPTTVLGDANDTIILELDDNWLTSARRDPAQPSELVFLSRSEVLAHHCVSPEALAYLAGEAEREGLQLTEGRYSPIWSSWVEVQRTANDLAAAQELLTVFPLFVDLRRKRQDDYVWNDILRLARNSKLSVKERPKHVETLLRSVRSISSAVAGVHSTAAFDLAVNVEWVEARLSRDPLKKKSLREAIAERIEAGRTSMWSSDPTACVPTSEGLDLLQSAFPRAYTEEITPTVVARVIRLLMAAKDRTLDPVDVSRAVSTAVGNDAGAALICVAVSGGLGPLITRRLIRTLQQDSISPLDWSTV